MDKTIIIQIIVGILLLYVLFNVIRMYHAFKLGKRLNKYIVNNNDESVSIGDKISIVYNRFKDYIASILKKSDFFKKAAVKYDKYVYLDSSLNIIASKFCYAIIFGFVYTLLALYNNTFNLFGLLLFMIVGYFAFNVYLIITENIRNKYIEEDLIKAIVIMNNAFKSGYNITQAIEFVAKDLTGPISDEFKRIGKDLAYGLELKDVFDRFYTRVRLNDVKYISSSLSLLNITGGNLVGIFTSIEKSFTNKKRLKDELNAMTSSSKLVFYILIVMPIIIVSILLLLSPNYFDPVFKHPLGILLCFLSVVLYIGYILIIRKILKVEA